MVIKTSPKTTLERAMPPLGYFISRFKKAINRDEKKHYPQKFVDTVVNGPLQNKKVKKRKLPPPLKKETLSPKAKKFSANTTNRLINISGSGIVLD